MRLAKATLTWAALAAAICAPIAFAAASPQLAWRGPVYILAGFAGIIALGLMLVQPLLIGGYLPGLSGYRGRRAHYWIGGALVVAMVVHVGGLWITSPPDMIDALLFVIADAVLPLGCDRHVGNLRCRAFGSIPPATATTNVAHRSYVPRGGHRPRRCGPRHAGRGNDGDGVEGGPLRAGPRRGHNSHGWLAGVEKASDVARRGYSEFALASEADIHCATARKAALLRRRYCKHRSFPRKRESEFWAKRWVPASAGTSGT